MEKGRILLSLIVGSRGAFIETVGSNLDLRQIIFYDDKRDQYGSHRSSSLVGQVSIWPFKHYLDKMFRFQWEAIQMLFCHPSNLLSFDPILIPLWRARQNLVCHEMLDKVTERSRKIFRAAFSDSQAPEGLHPALRYDPLKVVQAFDMIESVSFCLSHGKFCSQGSKWRDMNVTEILRRRSEKLDLKQYFKGLLQKLQEERMCSLRSPTSREVYRGEEPSSKILATVSPQAKTLLKKAATRVWGNIQKGPLGAPIKEEEITAAFGDSVIDRQGEKIAEECFIPGGNRPGIARLSPGPLTQPARPLYIEDCPPGDVEAAEAMEEEIYDHEEDGDEE